MKVVCVGDCGIDRYLPSQEKRVGGITANVARHALAQFPADDRIVLVSCLGDDDDAPLVRAAFDDIGIDCLWSQTAGRTPVQYIEILPDGERHFVRYEAGVLADFRFSEKQRESIASADLLAAPVYLQIVGLFDALMSIDTAGLVAIDFADFLEHPDFGLLDEHIDSIDIGFFGLNPDRKREIDHIASLAAGHGKLFVVTLGASGSIAFMGQERFECAPVVVPDVVDTTGAGDAYAAAFLSRYCHGADIDDAMQHGSLIAADVVARHGSFPERGRDSGV